MIQKHIQNIKIFFNEILQIYSQKMRTKLEILNLN